MSAQVEQPERRRKNVYGDNGTDTYKSQIRNLDDTWFEENNLRPVYQRDGDAWPGDKMNDFITNIMNNNLMPFFIKLYKLAEDQRIEENENKIFETIDGQHRLTAIKGFKDSTYVTVKKNKFVVCWKYENSCVFYKNTPDVDEWCEKTKITPQYLTKDERKYFDNYGINIAVIQNSLTKEERSQIFLDEQKNAPVRGSNLHKNIVGCNFTAYMRDNGYEKAMKDVFIECCNMATPQYWVEWGWRLLLLYKHFNGEDSEKSVSEIFIIKDEQIKQKYLNPSNTKYFGKQNISVIHAFNIKFRSFIEFLKEFEKNKNKKGFNEITYKLGATQIFALFYTLCDDSKNHDIMMSYVRYWSAASSTKIERQMWNCADQSQRCKKFSSVFNEINSITERAHPYDNRPIKKELRTRVWAKCVDGKCAICEEEIKETKFDAGHIVARARGGQTEIENLLPMCQFCNSDMSTRHAREYQKDMYPEKYAKYIAESELANQEI
jgi:hypothetical protein